MHLSKAAGPPSLPLPPQIPQQSWMLLRYLITQQCCFPWSVKQDGRTETCFQSAQGPQANHFSGPLHTWLCRCFTQQSVKPQWESLDAALTAVTVKSHRKPVLTVSSPVCFGAGCSLQAACGGDRGGSLSCRLLPDRRWTPLSYS